MHFTITAKQKLKQLKPMFTYGKVCPYKLSWKYSTIKNF